MCIRQPGFVPTAQAVAIGASDPRYTNGVYQRVATVSYPELVTNPRAVAERLVDRLLRALGTSERHPAAHPSSTGPAAMAPSQLRRHALHLADLVAAAVTATSLPGLRGATMRALPSSQGLRRRPRRTGARGPAEVHPDTDR